jgi:hypothetical protein
LTTGYGAGLQFAASANRRFEFEKRTQLFIRSHNEALSVVAMCISNEDGERVVTFSPASGCPSR